MTTKRKLMRRSHSIRNFDPIEIVIVADNEGKRQAREVLSYIESGRIKPMLRHTHKFFCALDRDEQKNWYKSNKELMHWVSAYGYSEDLNYFPKTVNFVDR